MLYSPAGLDWLQELQDAVRGSGVLLDNCAGTPAQFGRMIWIGQQTSNCRCQFSGILNLYCCRFLQKQSRDIPKVFHVWAKHNGLAMTSRFKHIVPSLRHKGSVYEDLRRVLENCGQFADAVQYEDAEDVAVRSQAAPAQAFNSPALDQLFHRLEPVGVAGRDDEFQLRMRLAQLGERIQHEFFFPWHPAGCNPDLFSGSKDCRQPPIQPADRLDHVVFAGSKY